MTEKSEKSGLSVNRIPLSTREGTESSARLPSDYSPTNLKVRGAEIRDISLLSMDYQLTVRPKVDLTRYQISMLLDTLCFEVVRLGINFSTWLTLEYLSSRLRGSRKIWEIRNPIERRVLLSAELLLLTSQSNWLSLEDRTLIPEEIVTYLRNNKLLPSERTYFSRIEYWQPSKFLEVRAVRLDVFFEKEKSSVPYSSYCKGYGESSRTGRRLKTRPSAELDGEETERPEVLLELQEILNLLYLNQIELTKNRKYRKA